MRPFRTRGGFPWLVLGLVAVIAVTAGCSYRGLPSSAAVTPAPPGCVLPDYHEERVISVEAWSIPDGQFAIGEPLLLEVTASMSGYLNIFHVGTTCGVTHLLRDAEVHPAQVIAFPDPESGVRILTALPAGQEAFYVLATGQPIGDLLGPVVLGEAAGMVSLALQPGDFYRFLGKVRLRRGTDGWGLTTLKTEVVKP